jgi:hypothetical protein
MKPRWRTANVVVSSSPGWVAAVVLKAVSSCVVRCRRETATRYPVIGREEPETA